MHNNVQLCSLETGHQPIALVPICKVKTSVYYMPMAVRITIIFSCIQPLLALLWFCGIMCRYYSLVASVVYTVQGEGSADEQ